MVADVARMAFVILVTCAIALVGVEANWDEWWTYDGISGATYWGVINPAWHICTRGKFQSPVDIQTERLVRDPTLTPVRIDKRPVDGGVLYNTGQSLVLKMAHSSSRLPVNMTGGPLSYR